MQRKYLFRYNSTYNKSKCAHKWCTEAVIIHSKVFTIVSFDHASQKSHLTTSLFLSKNESLSSKSLPYSPLHPIRGGNGARLSFTYIICSIIRAGVGLASCVAAWVCSCLKGMSVSHAPIVLHAPFIDLKASL